jgi:hypothetical protein
MALNIAPREVAAALAAHRLAIPRSVHLSVAPATVDDPTTFEQVLRSLLAEVVTNWPDGTTWIVTPAGSRGYLQGVHYAPTMCVEFGPGEAMGDDDWAWARDRGWLNPEDVSQANTDFVSRAIWGCNPVREVHWAVDSIPHVVAHLADAAGHCLQAAWGTALDIQIFTNVDDSDEDTDTSEHVLIPADVSSVILDVVAPEPVG